MCIAYNTAFNGSHTFLGSSLINKSTMASPFANYGDFFDVEYRVNGVWNRILHEYFETGFDVDDYIVCAETYPNPTDTAGKRMDLTLNRLMQPGADMEIDYAYLCYEGKGADGDTWEQLEDQLGDWFSDAEEYDHGAAQFASWVIATRGSLVRFYYYDTASMLDDKLVRKRIDANNQLVDATPLFRDYDITNNADWTRIVATLQWLNTNKP